MPMSSFQKNSNKTYYKQPKHVTAQSKAGVDPSPLNDDPCMQMTPTCTQCSPCGVEDVDVSVNRNKSHLKPVRWHDRVSSKIREPLSGSLNSLMTNARRQTQYRPCVHTLTLAHNETTQATCQLKHSQEQSETDTNKDIGTQYKWVFLK